MSRQSLYLECNSGISGDMTVAALLDLGADQEGLNRMLKSLPVEGFRIETSRTVKGGISAFDFQVILQQEQPGHRHMSDIERIISHAEANGHVKELALRMFQIVAEAESAAHGIPVEEVHFHEVGAVDSIVDILSAAYCLDNLEVDRVVITELWEGQGHVKCQHGLLPVPVPAVLNIVQSHGLPLHRTQTEGEMITPTGAAIAAAIRTDSRLPDTWQVVKTGIGAGKKDFPHANILRAMLIESCGSQEEHGLWVLETNVDDCTGEALGYTAEQLMKEGARDVTFTPVFMKKGRPAYQLSVLASEDFVARTEELIFLHTSTIGIRKYPVRRTALKRWTEEIATSLGNARVKYIQNQKAEGVWAMPEYESVRTLCGRGQLGFSQVYELVKREAEEAWKRKEASEVCSKR